MKIIIELDDKMLEVINFALKELPFKISEPLISKINFQIQKQHDIAAENRELIFEKFNS